MFEPAEGLFGTFITEEWIINEFARCHGVQISNLKIRRIGENEGSFSRVCLMECNSNGHLPQKLIVKIPTCLTYVENRRRRGWTHGDYSHIKDLLIKILKLYTNIQKSCAKIPDDVCARLNTNVFELLSTTTLSLETLTQRLNRMALWAPEITSTLRELVQLLPHIVDHTMIRRLHSECPFQHLLVHGDLYSSNILWQNGIVKAVIDYQMAHYGNPVEDFVRLFTTGLTVSERKAHTVELLEYYQSQITSVIPELEGSLTVDWLLSCYKRIFPMAGLWAMVSLHASFESATSQAPPDSIKLKTVVEKIHGIAADILQNVQLSERKWINQ